MPFRGQRCPGFEALPADVLAIILRENADHAQQDGAVSLAQAVQLLRGPCHHWSAVATAELTLRLRLESYQELEHPLLRRARITELILPAAPLPDTSLPSSHTHAGASADAAAAASQQAQAHAAAAVALLTSSGFLRHSAPCLTTLLNLPTAAAALAPVPLLHAFPRLRHVGLQASSATLRPAGLVPPGFFPPSVRCIEATAASIDSLSWLPSWHLDSVALTAASLRIMQPAAPPPAADPPLAAANGEVDAGGDAGVPAGAANEAPPGAPAPAGGLTSCTELRLTARDCLSVTVAALASVARCERLRLCCEAGKQLTVQPLPGDEEAVWADVPGPLYDHSLPAARLLPKWLGVLAPLFGPGSCLRSLDLSARRLFLAVHNIDFWFWGLQLLSPLPPAAPEGAALGPLPAGHEQPGEESLSADGLTATLRCCVAEQDACVLSLTRAPAAA